MLQRPECAKEAEEVLWSAGVWWVECWTEDCRDDEAVDGVWC